VACEYTHGGKELLFVQQSDVFMYVCVCAGGGGGVLGCVGGGGGGLLLMEALRAAIEH